MNRARSLVVALVLLCAGSAVAIAFAQDDLVRGRIGAASSTLGNGRHLEPFGRLVSLGNFPTGGAVTPDGRFLWTVSTGRGKQDIRIVAVRTGGVVQTLPIPGASGGIAMDTGDRLVYVSGVSGSSYKGQAPAPGTPGAAGDVIHVFRYDADGHASFSHLIPVPPQSGAPTPQNFPPTNTEKIAWPDRLAISPDGKTLLVPLNLADTAAVVDVRSKTVRYVATGHYPYGAAILRNGKTGLVSNETPGTVSVVDLQSATKVKDIQVGSHLSHPEAITLDPRADRAYVAIANTDQVAVIDTKRLALDRTLWVGRPEGLGTSPVDVAVTPDGARLLVAEAGADELAVLALPGHEPKGVAAYSLVGRIPTADYPAAVAATDASANACGFPKAKKKAKKKKKKSKKHAKHKKKSKKKAKKAAKKRSSKKKKSSKHKKKKRKKAKKKATKTCAKLLYVTGKGVGTGPNPSGPQPNTKEDSDDLINATQYLPLINFGAAGIADFPTDREIRALDRVADRQIRPVDPQQPPPDTPLRAGGPIKHVFYIVRENRTYDQVLGDDPRGDGDASLTLFGKQITPNAHALVGQFPLIDHLYANSEASIDGHFWTAAANVSDYVHKNWFQNYGGRKRPYDFGVYEVTWPGNGFLFDQAERQGISYFNYGEAVAGVVPSPTTVGPQLPLDDKDRTNEENLRVITKLSKSDLNAPACYPNDASVGKDAITMQPVFDSSRPLAAAPQSHSRFDCFRLHFTAQEAAGTIPAFNYIVLANDHTRVLSPGAYTPRAMVADNDLGLGQMVDLISHSSIWNESAIFVVEDDSQDGADHVDAHRTVGMVISPFAKRGAVIHTRYDMLSMIRSFELILGMRPLSLGDALATPMYDAFQASPSNAAPYTAITPGVDLLEQNPSADSFAARLSDRWMKLGTDRIPQRVSDRLLWWSIHGMHSTPPPPGPNAVHESADPKDRLGDTDD